MYEFQIICQQENKPRQHAKMLSNWAKAELLKEKVKQKMEAKYGKRLDSLADFTVEVMEGENSSEITGQGGDDFVNQFNGLDSWPE